MTPHDNGESLAVILEAAGTPEQQELIRRWRETPDKTKIFRDNLKLQREERERLVFARSGILPPAKATRHNDGRPIEGIEFPLTNAERQQVIFFRSVSAALASIAEALTVRLRDGAMHMRYVSRHDYSEKIVPQSMWPWLQVRAHDVLDIRFNVAKRHPKGSLPDWLPGTFVFEKAINAAVEDKADLSDVSTGAVPHTPAAPTAPGQKRKPKMTLAEITEIWSGAAGTDGARSLLWYLEGRDQDPPLSEEDAKARREESTYDDYLKRVKNPSGKPLTEEVKEQLKQMVRGKFPEMARLGSRPVNRRFTFNDEGQDHASA